MRQQATVWASVLVLATSAFGGVEVVLQCVEHPGSCNPGPGGSETVGVYLRQVPVGDPLLLRFVQFDFSDSYGVEVSLPVSHPAPSGRLPGESDIRFWDLSSTPTCQAAASDCGFGHFIDDDASETPVRPHVVYMTYVGDLRDPQNPDLNENVANQWLLPGDGSPKKIAEFQVKFSSGAYGGIVDLLNADESDPARGARIDYRFEPRVTWRARTGQITGGRLCIEDWGDFPPDLRPPCDGSLWRSANNTIRIDFYLPITPPAASEILIQELLPNGALGPDLSAGFTFTVENGSVLRIRENGTVLTNKKWYGIINKGWSALGGFEIDYAVLVGDFTGDKRVLSADVLSINAQVPCLTSCGDDRRADINGDGRILSADVLQANAEVPVLSVPKPSGHGCRGLGRYCYP